MGDGGEEQSTKRKILASIGEISAGSWNRLAGDENPFISHAFLRALETSGSATAETGWRPFHVAIDRRNGGALAPAYLKAHSFGEYVFDHHWADAYERAGGRYFPKLLVASPFTPVPGPRLLAGDVAGKAALAEALPIIAREAGASSVHANFLDPDDAGVLAERGFLIRIGVQYHWLNRGYRCYDDFLGALSSQKRKTMKRERREAAEGLRIRRVVGREISEERWDAFWRFYQDTGSRKWGRPYLTRAFFQEIAETMSERLMLVVAECDGRPIAGALNFIGGDALYGRYWGRLEERPFLHFEVCYHQAIEFAIERGLSRVEAGAQGEHKIARGYEPVRTLSAHWIEDPPFRQAIARYLEQERAAVEADVATLAQSTPYKSAGA